jgi:hypothetical protein
MRALLLALYVQATISSAASTWTAGGDAGEKWKASASSQYAGCDGYDLCDYQYTVDGTRDGGIGKTMALDGPGYTPFPQWVQVDFGRPVALSQWRIHSVGGDRFAAKNLFLQVGGKAVQGSNLTNVPATGIHNSPPRLDPNPGCWANIPPTYSHGLSAFQFSVSLPFSPITAQVWRVIITDMYDCSDPEQQDQLYINEIQFFGSCESFSCGGTCNVKPGVPPSYKPICAAKTDAKSCNALSLSCNWMLPPASSCQLKKGGVPQIYSEICAAEATAAGCTALNLTCAWAPTPTNP